MALVLAVVVVALVGSRTGVRRAIPSESLLAFGLMVAAVLLLFELGRLG